MGVIRAFPLGVHLLGLGALAMLVPMAHAMGQGAWPVARTFGYAMLLGLVLAGLFGLALVNRTPRRPVHAQFVALVLAYTLLPVFLAVPYYMSLALSTPLRAYFDMVAAITTTGAHAHDDDPLRLSDTLHLWRATVAWLGGLLVWVSAAAVLAPLQLGGFEVVTRLRGEHLQRGYLRIDAPEAAARLAAQARLLVPIYAGFTLVLWIGLLVAGQPGTAALILSMSTLATSGITLPGGVQGAGTGLGSEVLIFLFLFVAVSRRVHSPHLLRQGLGPLRDSRELRLALLITVFVPMLIFLRHWSGAFDYDDQENLSAALRAFWGGMFTVLSFLTTTGFVSAEWGLARAWSGLGAPGLVLAGLAMLGGGIATTAGGLKLLRVFAIYRQARNEVSGLLQPSRVIGAQRGLTREVGLAAWGFFMLFMITLTLVTLLLGLAGLDFNAALALAVATLTTTGPIAAVAGEAPIFYGQLSGQVQAILCGAMVVGRLETLAMLALFNPSFWRA